jgi:hypothetical protein
MSNNKQNMKLYNKQLSLIDALCIVKTGWRTEQEKELLDNAYLVIKKHAEVLHLEHQRQCIDEKLTELKTDDKQQTTNGSKTN